MPPSVMIVIPTHGHFDYASRAIRSALLNTTTLTPYVLLVDDASPEWTGINPPEDVSRLFEELPGCRLAFHRFPKNGGLTRSWNFGLSWAASHDCEVCCVTNSDVIFAPGWDRAIVSALAVEKNALVGPVTNAPGTNQDQYVGRYSILYDKQKGDDPVHIAAVQDELTAAQSGRTRETTLNGFCLVASTQTWWDNRFDDVHVFCPRNEFNSKGEPNPTPLMTLNEYELQRRWHAKGLKSVACLGSYVFHYRAVSRGDKYKRGDWSRA